MANSCSGRTGRLGRPEIHTNPVEKAVAATAPQGGILQRVVVLDGRTAGAQEGSGRLVGV